MAYSVVIKNDLSLMDGEGIHTWLEVKSPDKTKVFSFGPEESFSLLGLDSPGFFANEYDDSLLNRPLNQSKEIAITEEQYNNLLNNIIPAFKDSQPNYDLMPDGEWGENCTIAVNTILQGINTTMRGSVQSPFKLANNLYPVRRNKQCLQHLQLRQDKNQER